MAQMVESYAWTADTRRLRNWFIPYLLVWGGGLYAAIAGAGFTILFLCIIPYIPCVVYSYRVQRELNRAGVYKPGAWQVIAGVILLNPLAFGFLIPASVLLTSASITRRVRKGDVVPRTRSDAGGPPRPTAATDIETLRNGLRSPDADMRIQCATRLGDRGPAALAAVPDLELLRNDPIRVVRSRAEWAIESIQRTVGGGGPGVAISGGGDLPSGVLSAHARARVTLYLLYAGLVLAVAAILSGWAQHGLLAEMRAGVPIAEGRPEANDAREQLIALLQLAVFIATIVTWLVWQFRAYANLRLVGSRETEYTPGWSVGYWFIPILNLFRPYQITAELWRRSELQNARDPLGGLSGPALIGVWWIVYLVSGGTGRVYASMMTRAKTLEQFITVTDLGIVNDSIVVGSTILAILVVRGIDRFQQQFAASASGVGVASPTAP